MSNHNNDKNTEHLSPVSQIRMARELWLFTLYICHGLSSRKIPHDMFTETLRLKTGEDKDFIIYKPKWNSEAITIQENNLKVSILGVCFCTLDSALDSTFEPKPNHYTDSDIDTLRAIVYMFRCAFAHEPTKPRWKIKKKYQRVFRINEIHLKIDFTNLDNVIIEPSHHMGWQGIMNIFDYCLKTVISSKKGGLLNASG